MQNAEEDTFTSEIRKENELTTRRRKGRTLDQLVAKRICWRHRGRAKAYEYRFFMARAISIC